MATPWSHHARWQATLLARAWRWCADAWRWQSSVIYRLEPAGWPSRSQRYVIHLTGKRGALPIERHASFALPLPLTRRGEREPAQQPSQRLLNLASDGRPRPLRLIRGRIHPAWQRQTITVSAGESSSSSRPPAAGPEHRSTERADCRSDSYATRHSPGPGSVRASSPDDSPEPSIRTRQAAAAAVSSSYSPRLTSSSLRSRQAPHSFRTASSLRSRCSPVDRRRGGFTSSI